MSTILHSSVLFDLFVEGTRIDAPSSEPSLQTSQKCHQAEVFNCSGLMVQTLRRLMYDVRVKIMDRPSDSVEPPQFKQVVRATSSFDPAKSPLQVFHADLRQALVSGSNKTAAGRLIRRSIVHTILGNRRAVATKTQRQVEGVTLNELELVETDTDAALSHAEFVAIIKSEALLKQQGVFEGTADAVSSDAACLGKMSAQAFPDSETEPEVYQRTVDTFLGYVLSHLRDVSGFAPDTFTHALGTSVGAEGDIKGNWRMFPSFADATAEVLDTDDDRMVADFVSYDLDRIFNSTHADDDGNAVVKGAPKVALYYRLRVRDNQSGEVPVLGTTNRTEQNRAQNSQATGTVLLDGYPYPNEHMRVEYDENGTAKGVHGTALPEYAQGEADAFLTSTRPLHGLTGYGAGDGARTVKLPGDWANLFVNGVILRAVLRDATGSTVFEVAYAHLKQLYATKDPKTELQPDEAQNLKTSLATESVLVSDQSLTAGERVEVTRALLAAARDKAPDVAASPLAYSLLAVLKEFSGAASLGAARELVDAADRANAAAEFAAAHNSEFTVVEGNANVAGMPQATRDTMDYLLSWVNANLDGGDSEYWSGLDWGDVGHRCMLYANKRAEERRETDGSLAPAPADWDDGGSYSQTNHSTVLDVALDSASVRHYQVTYAVGVFMSQVLQWKVASFNTVTSAWDADASNLTKLEGAVEGAKRRGGVVESSPKAALLVACYASEFFTRAADAEQTVSAVRDHLINDLVANVAAVMAQVEYAGKLVVLNDTDASTLTLDDSYNADFLQYNTAAFSEQNSDVGGYLVDVLGSGSEAGSVRIQVTVSASALLLRVLSELRAAGWQDVPLQPAVGETQSDVDATKAHVLDVVATYPDLPTDLPSDDVLALHVITEHHDTGKVVTNKNLYDAETTPPREARVTVVKAGSKMKLDDLAKLKQPKMLIKLGKREVDDVQEDAMIDAMYAGGPMMVSRATVPALTLSGKQKKILSLTRKQKQRKQFTLEDFKARARNGFAKTFGEQDSIYSRPTAAEAIAERAADRFSKQQANEKEAMVLVNRVRVADRYNALRGFMDSAVQIAAYEGTDDLHAAYKGKYANFDVMKADFDSWRRGRQEAAKNKADDTAVEEDIDSQLSDHNIVVSADVSYTLTEGALDVIKAQAKESAKASRQKVADRPKMEGKILELTEPNVTNILANFFEHVSDGNAYDTFYKSMISKVLTLTENELSVVIDGGGLEIQDMSQDEADEFQYIVSKATEVATLAENNLNILLPKVKLESFDDANTVENFVLEKIGGDTAPRYAIDAVLTKWLELVESGHGIWGKWQNEVEQDNFLASSDGSDHGAYVAYYLKTLSGTAGDEFWSSYTVPSVMTTDVENRAIQIINGVVVSVISFDTVTMSAFLESKLGSGITNGFNRRIRKVVIEKWHDAIINHESIQNWNDWYAHTKTFAAGTEKAEYIVNFLISKAKGSVTDYDLEADIRNQFSSPPDNMFELLRGSERPSRIGDYVNSIIDGKYPKWQQKLESSPVVKNTREYVLSFLVANSEDLIDTGQVETVVSSANIDRIESFVSDHNKRIRNWPAIVEHVVNSTTTGVGWLTGYSNHGEGQEFGEYLFNQNFESPYGHLSEDAKKELNEQAETSRRAHEISERVRDGVMASFDQRDAPSKEIAIRSAVNEAIAHLTTEEHSYASDHLDDLLAPLLDEDEVQSVADSIRVRFQVESEGAWTPWTDAKFTGPFPLPTANKAKDDAPGGMYKLAVPSETSEVYRYQLQMINPYHTVPTAGQLKFFVGVVSEDALNQQHFGVVGPRAKPHKGSSAYSTYPFKKITGLYGKQEAYLHSVHNEHWKRPMQGPLTFEIYKELGIWRVQITNGSIKDTISLISTSRPVEVVSSIGRCGYTVDPLPYRISNAFVPVSKSQPHCEQILVSFKLQAPGGLITETGWENARFEDPTNGPYDVDSFMKRHSLVLPPDSRYGEDATSLLEILELRLKFVNPFDPAVRADHEDAQLLVGLFQASVKKHFLLGPRPSGSKLIPDSAQFNGTNEAKWDGSKPLVVSFFKPFPNEDDHWIITWGPEGSENPEGKLPNRHVTEFDRTLSIFTSESQLRVVCSLKTQTRDARVHQPDGTDLETAALVEETVHRAATRAATLHRAAQDGLRAHRRALVDPPGVMTLKTGLQMLRIKVDNGELQYPGLQGFADLHYFGDSALEYNALNYAYDWHPQMLTEIDATLRENEVTVIRVRGCRFGPYGDRMTMCVGVFDEPDVAGRRGLHVHGIHKNNITLDQTSRMQWNSSITAHSRNTVEPSGNQAISTVTPEGPDLWTGSHVSNGQTRDYVVDFEFWLQEDYLRSRYYVYKNEPPDPSDSASDAELLHRRGDMTNYNSMVTANRFLFRSREFKTYKAQFEEYPGLTAVDGFMVGRCEGKGDMRFGVTVARTRDPTYEAKNALQRYQASIAADAEYVLFDGVDFRASERMGDISNTRMAAALAATTGSDKQKLQAALETTFTDQAEIEPFLSLQDTPPDIGPESSSGARAVKLNGVELDLGSLPRVEPSFFPDGAECYEARVRLDIRESMAKLRFVAPCMEADGHLGFFWEIYPGWGAGVSIDGTRVSHYMMREGLYDYQEYETPYTLNDDQAEKLRNGSLIVAFDVTFDRSQYFYVNAGAYKSEAEADARQNRFITLENGSTFTMSLKSISHLWKSDLIHNDTGSRLLLMIPGGIRRPNALVKAENIARDHELTNAKALQAHDAFVGMNAVKSVVDAVRTMQNYAEKIEVRFKDANGFTSWKEARFGEPYDAPLDRLSKLSHSRLFELDFSEEDLGITLSAGQTFEGFSVLDNEIQLRMIHPQQADTNEGEVAAFVFGIVDRRAGILYTNGCLIGPTWEGDGVTRKRHKYFSNNFSSMGTAHLNWADGYTRGSATLAFSVQTYQETSGNYFAKLRMTNAWDGDDPVFDPSIDVIQAYGFGSRSSTANKKYAPAGGNGYRIVVTLGRNRAQRTSEVIGEDLALSIGSPSTDLITEMKEKIGQTYLSQISAVFAWCACQSSISADESFWVRLFVDYMKITHGEEEEKMRHIAHLIVLASADKFTLGTGEMPHDEAGYLKPFGLRQGVFCPDWILADESVERSKLINAVAKGVQLFYMFITHQIPNFNSYPSIVEALRVLFEEHEFDQDVMDSKYVKDNIELENTLLNGFGARTPESDWHELVAIRIQPHVSVLQKLWYDNHFVTKENSRRVAFNQKVLTKIASEARDGTPLLELVTRNWNIPESTPESSTDYEFTKIPSSGLSHVLRSLSQQLDIKRDENGEVHAYSQYKYSGHIKWSGDFTQYTHLMKSHQSVSSPPFVHRFMTGGVKPRPTAQISDDVDCIYIEGVRNHETHMHSHRYVEFLVHPYLGKESAGGWEETDERTSGGFVGLASPNSLILVGVDQTNSERIVAKVFDREVMSVHVLEFDQHDQGFYEFHGVNNRSTNNDFSKMHIVYTLKRLDHAGDIRVTAKVYANHGFQPHGARGRQWKGPYNQICTLSFKIRSDVGLVLSDGNGFFAGHKLYNGDHKSRVNFGNGDIRIVTTVPSNQLQGTSVDIYGAEVLFPASIEKTRSDKTFNHHAGDIIGPLVHHFHGVDFTFLKDIKSSVAGDDNNYPGIYKSHFMSQAMHNKQLWLVCEMLQKLVANVYESQDAKTSELIGIANSHFSAMRMCLYSEGDVQQQRNFRNKKADLLELFEQLPSLLPMDRRDTHKHLLNFYDNVLAKTKPTKDLLILKSAFKLDVLSDGWSWSSDGANGDPIINEPGPLEKQLGFLIKRKRQRGFLIKVPIDCVDIYGDCMIVDIPKYEEKFAETYDPKTFVERFSGRAVAPSVLEWRNTQKEMFGYVRHWVLGGDVFRVTQPTYALVHCRSIDELARVCAKNVMARTLPPVYYRATAEEVEVMAHHHHLQSGNVAVPPSMLNNYTFTLLPITTSFALVRHPLRPVREFSVLVKPHYQAFDSSHHCHYAVGARDRNNKYVIIGPKSTGYSHTDPWTKVRVAWKDYVTDTHQDYHWYPGYVEYDVGVDLRTHDVRWTLASKAPSSTYPLHRVEFTCHMQVYNASGSVILNRYFDMQKPLDNYWRHGTPRYGYNDLDWGGPDGDVQFIYPRTYEDDHAVSCKLAPVWRALAWRDTQKPDLFYNIMLKLLDSCDLNVFADLGEQPSRDMGQCALEEWLDDRDLARFGFVDDFIVAMINVDALAKAGSNFTWSSARDLHNVTAGGIVHTCIDAKTLTTVFPSDDFGLITLDACLKKRVGDYFALQRPKISNSRIASTAPERTVSMQTFYEEHVIDAADFKSAYVADVVRWLMVHKIVEVYDEYIFEPLDNRLKAWELEGQDKVQKMRHYKSLYVNNDNGRYKLLSSKLHYTAAFDLALFDMKNHWDENNKVSLYYFGSAVSYNKEWWADFWNESDTLELYLPTTKEWTWNFYDVHRFQQIAHPMVLHRQLQLIIGNHRDKVFYKHRLKTSTNTIPDDYQDDRDALIFELVLKDARRRTLYLRVKQSEYVYSWNRYIWSNSLQWQDWAQEQDPSRWEELKEIFRQHHLRAKELIKQRNEPFSVSWTGNEEFRGPLSLTALAGLSFREYATHFICQDWTQGISIVDVISNSQNLKDERHSHVKIRGSSEYDISRDVRVDRAAGDGYYLTQEPHRPRTAKWVSRWSEGFESEVSTIYANQKIPDQFFRVDRSAILQRFINQYMPFTQSHASQAKHTDMTRILLR